LAASAGESDRGGSLVPDPVVVRWYLRAEGRAHSGPSPEVAGSGTEPASASRGPAG